MNSCGPKYMKIPQFPPDFKEFLRLFLVHRVRFLIVGGYAVAYHGHPRLTGDLDIWVERSQENAGNIMASLREFGFDLPNLRPELFLKPDAITRMGVEPMKIEIFTHIPGLSFAQSYAARCETTIDVGPLPFLSLKDLRESKKTSGRHRDLADLEELPEG